MAELAPVEMITCSPCVRPPFAQKAASTLVLEQQLGLLAGGYTPALRVIYDLTHSRLFKVALGILSDRQESEDVVQDAYISIWRNAELYRSDSNGTPMPWLMRIVRNGAIDKLRKRRHVELDADDKWAATLIDPTPCALTQLETKQQALLVAKMVEGLSLRAAAALHIAFFQDETYAVVAEQLGLPEGTIKSIIRRTLERLRPDAERVRNGESPIGSS